MALTPEQFIDACACLLDNTYRLACAFWWAPGVQVIKEPEITPGQFIDACTCLVRPPTCAFVVGTSC